MDFQDLQALLWLVQHGSLQGASRAENVSRTTMRRRLDNLEAALGMPTLEFVGSQFRLTPAGELLVDQGAQLMSQRAALLQRARRAMSSPQGQIRVLLDSGFPAPLIAQTTAMLSSNQPDVRLNIRLSPEPMREAGEDYDLVLFWGHKTPTWEGVSRTFLRIPMRLMASPAYLEAHGQPQAVSELRAHRLLQDSSEPESWPLLSGGHLPIVTTHRVNDLFVLGCMVGAGVGIALLPKPDLPIDPTFDSMVAVLPDQIGRDLSVRFFAPLRTAHGPAGILVSYLNQLADSVGSLS